MLNRYTGYKRLLALAALSGGAAPVERTATGNPLTFGTDLASPLKSLLIPFTPVQSGTGDPSPQNIRSIIPWNGLKVDQIGENAWGNRTTQNVTRYSKVALLKPIPPGTYTITATVETDTASSKVGIGFAKGENMVIETVYLSPNERSSATFTINETVTIVYLYAGIDYSTASGYTATYKGILIEAGTKAPTETDISFPSPVYGGTLDVVSGVLTVEYGIYTLTGNEEYGLTGSGQHVMTVPSLATLNCKSFVDKDLSTGLASFAKTKKYNDLNASGETDGIGIGSRYIIIGSVQYDALSQLVGEQICYELAEPYTITLTPQQITALVGDNTIWSDADGSMTAVYLVSSKYAEEHPVGGLGSGLLGGGFGSGTGEPDEPVEPDEPGEPDQPEEQ